MLDNFSEDLRPFRRIDRCILTVEGGKPESHSTRSINRTIHDSKRVLRQQRQRLSLHSHGKGRVLRERSGGMPPKFFPGGIPPSSSIPHISLGLIVSLSTPRPQKLSHDKCATVAKQRIPIIEMLSCSIIHEV